MALTPKQRRFVAEYGKDLNATQAAIRAGYSAKTAHVQGPRLLGNVSVSEAIANIQGKALAKAGLTVEGTLEQLRRILHFDIAELYDDNGKLLPVKLWPEHARTAVAGVETEDKLVNEGDDEKPELLLTRVNKVKITDRMKAIDLAMRHFGLLVERQEVKHTLTLEVLVADSMKTIEAQ